MLAENLYNVQPVQREHRVYTMEKKSKSKQQTLSNGERKLAFATVMAIGAVLLIVIALTAVVATTAYGNSPYRNTVAEVKLRKRLRRNWE